MDPDEALRQIRLTAEQMQVEDQQFRHEHGHMPFIQHGRDLAEQVQALDEWLAKGGFLPEAWSHGREPKDSMTL